MKTRKWVGMAACLLLAGGTVQAAHAFDLTGNWQGRWTCRGFDGTKFADSNLTSTMAITQTGDTLYVSIDGGGFRYNGAAAPDTIAPTARGEIALVACGTDLLPMAGGEAEMVRARVAVKPTTGQGVLKGASVYEGFGPTGYVGSCKYVYKRVDQTDPGVGPCP